MKLNIGEDLKDSTASDLRNSYSLTLPQGLFGFSEIKGMELFFDPDELPFMWLRESDENGLAFIVIEPGGIVPNYVV
jgi:flagellar assembly factor FliW